MEEPNQNYNHGIPYANGMINRSNNHNHTKVDLAGFPPGYRFVPSDHDLIINYLIPKIQGRELPSNYIRVINIYKHNPEYLAKTTKAQGDKTWYFFTSRDRKYKNGHRPDRSAGDGYWKATGADKKIKDDDGKAIGFRKALVFYKGRPPKGDKTSWIMQEFRVSGPPRKRAKGDTSMRLDDYVLCAIYIKGDRSHKKENKPQEQMQQQAVEDNVQKTDGQPEEQPVVGEIEAHQEEQPVVGETGTWPSAIDIATLDPNITLIYNNNNIEGTSYNRPFFTPPKQEPSNYGNYWNYDFDDGSQTMIHDTLLDIYYYANMNNLSDLHICSPMIRSDDHSLPPDDTMLGEINTPYGRDTVLSDAFPDSSFTQVPLHQINNQFPPAPSDKMDVKPPPSASSEDEDPDYHFIL